MVLNIKKHQKLAQTLANRPISYLYRYAVNHLLKQVDSDVQNGDPRPLPTDLASDCFSYTSNLIKLRNGYIRLMTPKKQKADDLWRVPTDLAPSQIALLLNHEYHIVLLNLSGINGDSDLDPLAIYQEKGINKGIYTTDENDIDSLARQFSFNISTNAIKEIKAVLRTIVPHVNRNSNPDLIPVNNGIFDYRSKILLPFSPKLIFIAKSHVNYNEHAKNKNIHNNQDGTDWDVESWMNSLSDDPEIVNVLWQILGAIIRPNVAWDKSAWLYSTRGNNGKGTLCELMRNLCGPGSYAKVSLRDFSQDFMLEPLTRANAIITDENDVGTYIDKAANLKAVETGDVITINRKFKPAIAYQFKGFMVQCLNEFPKVKDRSESFYRRQLFIPMTKNFQGRERKYIKQEYLHDPEVLEYVLYKLLNTNYYELDIPDACQDTMNEYKDANDPIRQFLSEILPSCVWDLLPFDFLYDLYRAWFIRNVPNGKAISKHAFNSELKDIFTGTNVSDFTYRGKQEYTGQKMNQPEMLINTYNLRNWMDPSYSGPDKARRCIPNTKPRYTGLVRVSNQTNSQTNAKVGTNQAN